MISKIAMLLMNFYLQWLPAVSAEAVTAVSFHWLYWDTVTKWTASTVKVNRVFYALTRMVRSGTKSRLSVAKAHRSIFRQVRTSTGNIVCLSYVVCKTVQLFATLGHLLHLCIAFALCCYHTVHMWFYLFVVMCLIVSVWTLFKFTALRTKEAVVCLSLFIVGLDTKAWCHSTSVVAGLLVLK